MSKNEAYLSLTPITNLEVAVLGAKKQLSVKDHADGLLYMLPVFVSKAAALKYAAEREVVTLEVTESDDVS